MWFGDCGSARNAGPSPLTPCAGCASPQPRTTVLQDHSDGGLRMYESQRGSQARGKRVRLAFVMFIERLSDKGLL